MMNYLFAIMQESLTRWNATTAVTVDERLRSYWDTMSQSQGLNDVRKDFVDFEQNHLRTEIELTRANAKERWELIKTLKLSNQDGKTAFYEDDVRKNMTPLDIERFKKNKLGTTSTPDDADARRLRSRDVRRRVKDPISKNKGKGKDGKKGKNSKNAVDKKKKKGKGGGHNRTSDGGGWSGGGGWTDWSGNGGWTEEPEKEKKKKGGILFSLLNFSEHP